MGRGKRAAFAIFYGPLHFVLVEHIVRSLPDARSARTIIDLGCGTGAAGAAWALQCDPTATIVGIDRSAWALGEAADTYRRLHLSGHVRRENVAGARLPRSPVAILAAFTLNELTEPERDALLGRLLARPRDPLLIVEPIAGFVAPWWTRWRQRFESAGGRGDEWRFAADLPPIVTKLDRAAGLNHREIAGRSLWRPALS